MALGTAGIGLAAGAGATATNDAAPRFTEVAAGSWHSLALTENGLVYAWGYNADGQLGLGDTAYRAVPHLVALPAKAVHVAAGSGHSLARTEDGRVFAWGNNDNGQLGLGDLTGRLTPQAVEGLDGMTEIAAGQYHSHAVAAGGQLHSWGSNSHGQLGLGIQAGANVNRTTPQPVAGMTDITAIEAGYVHSLAITATGV
ncbi:MAG: hypothetical protein LBT54_06830, partial [Bifidobacteriaceae bacterium]|nr:hypothetical protein [Bifidobacteriaceae bacterium]